MSQLYAEEGRDLFTVRQNIFGEIQKGGSPSPFDRNFATEMTAQATNWMIEKVLENFKDGKVVTNDHSTAGINVMEGSDFV